LSTHLHLGLPSGVFPSGFSSSPPFVLYALPTSWDTGNVVKNQGKRNKHFLWSAPLLILTCGPSAMASSVNAPGWSTSLLPAPPVCWRDSIRPILILPYF
jgi:hypothetical protein